MKFGIRTPSPRKRAAAYGRGRYTRSIKRKLIPGYGKKGMGFLKNPSKSVYNKIYRRTTIGSEIYKLISLMITVPLLPITILQ